MIPLPNLPTDNLYKLLALSGLTLAVLSWVLWFVQATGPVQDKLDQFRVDTTVLTVEQQALDSDLAFVKAHPSALPGIQQRLRETAVQIAALRAKTRNVQLFTKRIALLGFLAILGVLAGAALASSGFILWYQRVQRFQDQLLRAQATSPPTGDRA